MGTENRETRQFSRRETAEAFVAQWHVYASPVDAVELLLKCRDERAARIIKEHRESDRCEGSCWEIISKAITAEVQP